MLALAALAALLGAWYLLDLGLVTQAALLVLAALATTVVALVWWRRRGTTTGRWAAGLLLPAGFASWFLADNLSGLPLVGIAVCALVLEFGIAIGAAAAAALVGAVGFVYAIHGVEPLGGVVANMVMMSVLVALGLLASQVVASLEEARDLAEAAARSRRDEALAEMDRALASERMEHARTLHDDLGQRLTLIGMGLDLALRQRASDPDGAWAEVGRSRAEAANALTALRTLVRALSPLTAQEAAEVDLDAALDRLAGAFSGTGLAVDLVRERGAAAPRLDSLAYRIIQEGLTNVVRHSDARHVTITLATLDDRRVLVADDGGTSGRLEPGFGLRHLRARVEAVGGTLDAAPGASGFVLDARYPATVPA